MTLTEKQLTILQHTLGATKYGTPQKKLKDFMRNHFCAGGDDEVVCRELVGMGLMETWAGADESGRVPGYPYYNCSVTEQGKLVVRTKSTKAPQKPKRWRTPIAAQGQLIARWGKCECELAVVYVNGPGTKTGDGHLLYQALNVPGALSRGLLEELEARGYDLTTLQFSISKKVPC